MAAPDTGIATQTEADRAAAAARALARWENEGGRIVSADPRPRG